MGNFACVCRLPIFFKIYFSNNSFQHAIRLNSLDPDQARRFVGPDLGPNRFQKLSADDNSREYFQILVLLRRG